MAELHISDDTFKRLTQVARAEGRDAADVIAEALAVYIDDAAKLKALRNALTDGEASGIADTNPFARLRAKRSLPAT